MKGVLIRWFSPKFAENTTCIEIWKWWNTLIFFNREQKLTAWNLQITPLRPLLLLFPNTLLKSIRHAFFGSLPSMRVRGWWFAPSVLCHYHPFFNPVVMAKPALSCRLTSIFGHVCVPATSLPSTCHYPLAIFLHFWQSPIHLTLSFPPRNKPQPLGHVGIVHNRGLLI